MSETSQVKIPKLEENGNSLLQSYINTFNKEIEGNEVSLQVPSEIDDEDKDAPCIHTSIEIRDVELGEGDDGTPNGTYFVDEQGHYYFQTNSQVITSVGDVLNGENEQIMLAEETNNELLVDPAEAYQTVTIVPSETSNGEVSYVLIVQQSDDKSQGEAATANVNVAELNNHHLTTVYDFDENEDVEESKRSTEPIDNDEDKVKSVVAKKQQPMSKPHMCSYCSYTTSKKYLLSRHMKSHSEERPHKCSVCSRGFKTLASLQNHVNIHTGIKPHKCRYCDSAFTTSGELVRHVRYRHTHEKPHKCSECEYASVELSKLKRHSRCHTGERPYQCPHCTYASPDTFKLKRHLRTHTGEKPYECEFCHMCFTQSNSLKAHKLRHNVGNKPVFSCELCPTTCGRKTDLRIHVQKLHTSDIPLKCRRCGKSFPDRYTFKIHNKTHDGEKCYKCDMCTYASASLRHLSSHMLVHTDEKPYGCEKCEQTFRQKQLLKRHQNLYHNPEYIPPLPKEKSQECVECGKQFRHKGNLIRHMALHDPESGIHEEAIRLKLGRQRKVLGMGGEVSRLPTDFDDKENSEEYDEEAKEDAENMPHYVVFEVIQVPEENSSEEIAVVSSKPYIAEEFDNDNSKLPKSKSTESPKNKSSVNTGKDVENCFGFDVDENEEDLDDQKIGFYEMKLLRDPDVI